MSDDYPDWFEKKKWPPFFRSWFFEDIDKLFHDMERMMEKEFETFTSKIPKEYMRELEMPKGKRIREWGPFVYGYSVKIGSDGKPELREFGNVKQSRSGPRVTEKRDPLIDVIETNADVQIVAEMPGVEKKDIKLRGTENKLTISVDTSLHKYFKEVELPARVNVRKTETHYKNGVLEVKMPKIRKAQEPEGEPISIE